jgi:tetratricopeptide (TPR) repeat protein
MNCVACAAPNVAGADHCAKCHAPLPPTCHSCGTPVPHGVELCHACRTEQVELIKPTDSAHLVETAPKGPEFELDSRFVGRRDFLEQLTARFSACVEHRELAFLALAGAPGVGKTRLARELGRAARVAVPGARVLYGRCGGPGADTYAAVARLFAARFGIADGDDAATARDKVQAGVAEVIAAERVSEVSHLLAHLCGCPFPQSPIIESLAEVPAQLELRIFVAVRRFLAADAEVSPLLLVFDEVERASSESVNMFLFLAAGLGEAPVMILALGRPEMLEVHGRLGAGDHPPERIDLPALAADECATLFEELLRPVGAIPDSLQSFARERLGGSPRAAHELARLLVEAGVVQPTPSGWRLDRAMLKATQLPETAEDLPQARLKILDESERLLLQKAAIMGEAFWLDAVVALVRSQPHGGDPDGPSLAEIAKAGERTRVAIGEAFARLARRGWLVESTRTSIPGELEYHFAYPPLWDLVYQTIPEENRTSDHRVVAQWLSLTPEGRSEKREEVVARHLERCGDAAGASHHYRRAADVARSAYQNERAIQLYQITLRCLGLTHVAARIITWHDLGSVYQLRGEYEHALNAYERMLRLAWVLSSRSKAAVAFNKMGRVWRDKGDLKVALEYLERGLELFQQAGDERGVAGSLDDVGQVLWLLDRYEQAMERSLTALEKRRELGDLRSIAWSLVNVGNIHKGLGRFAQAGECYREALAHQRETHDRLGEAETLSALGALHFDRGEISEAHGHWELGLRIAEEIGAVPSEVLLRTQLGELLLALERLPEARKHLEEAISLAQDIDEKRQQSEAARNLGLLALRQGRFDEAQQLSRRALDLAEPAGFRQESGRALLAIAEVRSRLTKGRGTALKPNLSDTAGNTPAETYYMRAIDLFREVGNDGELAKALERFGRHRLDRGDRENARRLLGEARDLYQKVGSALAEQLDEVLTGLDSTTVSG